MTDVGRARIATGSQTVGPFFHFALGTNTALGRMAPPGTSGEPVRLFVHVVDGDGAPLPDSLIELWHADADGEYVRRAPDEQDCTTPRFCGFGRMATDVNGRAEFETIRPGRVPDGQGGRQAPHINVCLFARGLLRHIYTRVYFAGDPALPEDAVLALVPADRRATLMAEPIFDQSILGEPDAWRFDIRLQGDRETVFFDL